MINSHELEISNKSYINKDFQKLYPEILELARKLSAKWERLKIKLKIKSVAKNVVDTQAKPESSIVASGTISG